MQSRLPALLLVSLLFTPGAPASSSAEAARRHAEIRRDILKNLHFNFHCFCMAADPETVQVVRGHVTEQDIPVLIQLLTDSHVQVRHGASGVLVRIGPASIPALEVAASSHEGTALPQDAEALRVIANTLRLIHAHSRPLASPTPIPSPARK